MSVPADGPNDEGKRDSAAGEHASGGVPPPEALRALVSLLDDPNAQVAASCRARVLALGAAVLPYLEEAAAAGGARGLIAQSMIGDLRRARADREFLRAAAAGSLDLEQGAFLLARTAYPDLDEAPYRERLAELAVQLEPRIDARTDARRIALELGTLLGGVVGLRGNLEDYYDPDNSFLNRVLDRRTGIPISLCAVYLLVARRLGLPVHPVAMPSHFVLCVGACAPPAVNAPAADDAAGAADADDIDVFLDAFSGGKVLKRTDCQAFLAQLGMNEKQHLRPCSDRAMLARMVLNLVVAYRRQGDAARAERYQRLHDALRD